MWRRVKQFAVGLSLVLCMTTAALWVRSYVVADTLRWQSKLKGSPGVSSSAVASDRGGVGVWGVWENFADSQDGFAWTRREPWGYLKAVDGKYRSVASNGHLLGLGYLKEARSSSFFYTSSRSA